MVRTPWLQSTHRAVNSRSLMTAPATPVAMAWVTPFFSTCRWRWVVSVGISWVSQVIDMADVVRVARTHPCQHAGMQTCRACERAACLPACVHVYLVQSDLTATLQCPRPEWLELCYTNDKGSSTQGCAKLLSSCADHPLTRKRAVILVRSGCTSQRPLAFKQLLR